MKQKLALFLKRVLDLTLSSVALAFLAIPFLLIALAIRLDSPGPAFFRQVRVGRGGREFRVWKFRTMVKDAERIGLGLNVSADDSRITRVGRLLREWGLDELPQLINVWCGEMSLVGPRPTVPAQVALYDDYERRRLEVKPGITGWALIHGRNALTWEARIRYDVWYVDHWSIWVDLYVLLRTFPVVLSRQGLYGPGGINDDLVARRLSSAAGEICNGGGGSAECSSLGEISQSSLTGACGNRAEGELLGEPW